MTDITINKEELSSIKTDGTMITVGLDFGTHQSKICIESKGGVELKYSFMKFKNCKGEMSFTLPSIIGICKNNRLIYGYLPNGFNGRIIRYFKQATFRTNSPDKSMTQYMSMYYSVWYIAYILFDLESVFGQEFTIQMGAPTDSIHAQQAKIIATQIIVSAYKLVEDVFKNDKQRFLDTQIDELRKVTEIVGYSKSIKEEYGLLVFPEAYACLKPLISQKKIATGMSLMIDIGGGTTDISFFTIENNSPQVYDFFSINKGLNYLTCADEKHFSRLDSNIKSAAEIDKNRRKIYFKEINDICNRIRTNLGSEFKKQTSFKIERLFDALKYRPLVYCGGGSTFQVLCQQFIGFQDVKLVSEREWNVKSILQMPEIRLKHLCPILSTAYGLAISTENDNIVMKPFKDIFRHIRGLGEERKNQKVDSTFGSAYGGFNYADDYDAWK